MGFNVIKLIRLEGLNFERFFNFAVVNKIKLHNVVRKEVGVVELKILESDYNSLRRKNAFKNYKVLELGEVGLNRHAKKANWYIGLVCSLLLSVVLFVFFSQFTFNIKVQGTSVIDESKIILFLKQNKIKTGKINQNTNEQIELMLKQNFEDISLVSVIRQGTNLIINIKEKELNAVQEYSAVLAPQNMLITKITTIQGTATKQAGDVVRKGDVLVEPYTIDPDGNKVSVLPIVEIGCDVWYSGVEVFEKRKTVQKRTGKSVSQSYYEFMGMQFLNSQAEHGYKLYEQVHTNSFVFNNHFLPIKVVKTQIYELKEVVLQQSFEKVKQKIIDNTIKLAYEQMPKNEVATDQKTVVTELDDKVIVQTSLLVQKSFSVNKLQ